MLSTRTLGSELPLWFRRFCDGGNSKGVFGGDMGARDEQFFHLERLAGERRLVGAGFTLSPSINLGVGDVTLEPEKL